MSTTVEVDPYNWQRSGACRNHPLGANAWTDQTRRILRAARAVCVGERDEDGNELTPECPVKALCLAWAQKHDAAGDEIVGLYGGHWFSGSRLCQSPTCFETIPITTPGRQRYCSDACRPAARPRLTNRICAREDCLNVFRATSGNHRFCSEQCQVANKRARKRSRTPQEVSSWPQCLGLFSLP